MAARLTARPLRILGSGLVLLTVVGCADLSAPATGGPAATPIGSPALGAAAAVARAAVFDALGSASLIVADTAIPYRPAESAPLAAAPRNVYQVTLPQDPDEGFVVVYALPTEAAAAAAAETQREYLASGPGRVQSPLGTDHVIQQLGSAIIVYDWLPPEAQDPAAPKVAEALRTIGTTFSVGS